MSSWEPALHQPVQLTQQGQLPGGGEGRLGLVQQVDALAVKAAVHQIQKALPVGLVVQGLAAIVSVKFFRRGEAPPGQLLHLGGGVVKALRPQEKNPSLGR